jgi:hypothetical protein
MPYFVANDSGSAQPARSDRNLRQTIAQFAIQIRNRRQFNYGMALGGASKNRTYDLVIISDAL